MTVTMLLSSLIQKRQVSAGTRVQDSRLLHKAHKREQCQLTPSPMQHRQLAGCLCSSLTRKLPITLLSPSIWKAERRQVALPGLALSLTSLRARARRPSIQQLLKLFLKLAALQNATAGWPLCSMPRQLSTIKLRMRSAIELRMLPMIELRMLSATRLEAAICPPAV